MPVDHEALKQFLFEHVEDVVELEILACFRQRQRDALAIADVAATTRFPTAIVEETLERLVARGMLSPTEMQPAAYRSGITNAIVLQVLDLVIAEYRSNPVCVMQMMTSNAIERVRTAAIVSFAECFRIRRNKPNG